ncbi:MAG: hypothetical protein M1833_005910, partial [Piccolia ochrophora]
MSLYGRGAIPSPYGAPMLLVITTVGALAFGAGYMIKTISSVNVGKMITESPRTSLIPILTDVEIANLPYPPNGLPGARDVASPYGSLRVYEWGPETGRKVLLLHGISTPCIALRSVAQQLVERGCRVMLFDLWGRGYSDGPTDVPYDVQLYTSQILLAITSSPLSWTGSSSDGFSLVGYSLGGGIAVAFTSYFPHLVSSLVLLAPSGLLRRKSLKVVNKLLSYGLLPESILRWRISRQLNKLKETSEEQNTITEVPVKSVESTSPASDSRPRLELDSSEVVAWQLRHHPGFPTAYLSSLERGPVIEQHAYYRRLGRTLSADRKALRGDASASVRPRLGDSKVLVILGEADKVIEKDETVEDAIGTLGVDNVEFRFVDAGHDFPITRAKE